MGKNTEEKLRAGTHACDDCDVEPATIRVTATTLDGVVLDSYLICRSCAEMRYFSVGAG